MRVLIDGDGCPVVDIAVQLCREFRTECMILCDTAHEIHRDGVLTLTFDKGADSVDFAIANRIQPGDLVITQDYGLASMCLARKARASIRMDGSITNGTSMCCCFSDMRRKNTVLPADESRGLLSEICSRTTRFVTLWSAFLEQCPGIQFRRFMDKGHPFFG